MIIIDSDEFTILFEIKQKWLLLIKSVIYIGLNKKNKL